MKAAIRYLHSPDVNDLESFQPADPEAFGLSVQVMAGPADGAGEESFDVVCTPGWLAERVRSRGPLFGRHHVIFDAYDFDQIKAVLTDAVESEEAPTWNELGERLGRIGKWCSRTISRRLTTREATRCRQLPTPLDSIDSYRKARHDACGRGRRCGQPGDEGGL